MRYSKIGVDESWVKGVAATKTPFPSTCSGKTLPKSFQSVSDCVMMIYNERYKVSVTDAPVVRDGREPMPEREVVRK